MAAAASQVLLLHILLLWGNCNTMELEGTDAVHITARLAERAPVEGESLDLILRYHNTSAESAFFFLPDPTIPETFPFVVEVQDAQGRRLSQIDAATLPTTEHGLHAEPEEVELMPEAALDVRLNLSPYLPALAPGGYALNVSSADGMLIEPDVLPFDVVALPRVQDASTVQDAPQTGLTTVYLFNLEGRDVLILEEMEDFATGSVTDGQWPIRYRRRIVDEPWQGEGVRRVYLAKKSSALQSVRHMMVEDASGFHVVRTEEGRLEGRAAIGPLPGVPIEGSLVSEADASLSFVTRGAGGALSRWRHDPSALRGPTVLEGVGSGYVTVFTEGERPLLFYLGQDHRTLYVAELATPSDAGRRLWAFEQPIHHLDVRPVLRADEAGCLILAAGGDGEVSDFLFWDFSGAPEPASPAQFAAQLGPVAFVVAADDAARVVTFDGRRFQSEAWAVDPGATTFVAAAFGGPIRFIRSGGWWERVP